MSDTIAADRPKRYFAIHFYLLRFLGLGWWHHPDEDDNNNFPGLYIYYTIITEVIWVAGFISLESIDPFIGEKNMDRLMFSLSFVITHDLTIIKILIFLFKNRAIQDVVRTLEIDVYNFYQNNERNRATIKITRIMIGSFVFFGWIVILNTDVYGIIQDIKWKAEVVQINDTSLRSSRTLPLPIYIPWNYETDMSYIWAIVFETMGLLWTGHILITIDTFIGSTILHMSTQFVILQEAFITSYDRALSQLITNIPQSVMHENLIKLIEDEDDGDTLKDFLDTMEVKITSFYTEKQIESAIEKTVLNCIRQHQVLISCVDKFRDTYSYGFMTQLLSSMAAICAVMVQVSQDASSLKSVRLVTSLAFFAAMIIQLAIQCFTGNELTLQAERVSDAVMQSKWEIMTPRVRRYLLMVMIRAQQPLRLTAAGFAYMNNECFVSIMKAAYSYYAVLSQREV